MRKFTKIAPMIKSMRASIDEQLRAGAVKISSRVYADVRDLLSDVEGAAVSEEVVGPKATVSVTAPVRAGLKKLLTDYADMRMSSKVAVTRLFADSGIR